MTTILTVGCFDLLHVGHLEHLRQARAMGDRLIVGVTSDECARKGPGRPINTLEKRMEVLNALKMVNKVVPYADGNAVNLIRKIKPDIYVRGHDYLEKRDDPNLILELKAAIECGGETRFTTGVIHSTTDFIRDHFENFAVLPQATQEWLRAFEKEHPASEVLSWLDKAAALKVCVVGERITDEYVYVTPEGRSAKESIIVWKETGRDEWEGGSSAVAANARAVSDHVVLADCGKEIIKRRYVQRPFLTKVFATIPRKSTVEPFRDMAALTQADLVIVVDYGHGLIPAGIDARFIAGSTKFLALNVQANSLNWGLNTLQKWRPLLDYGCGAKYPDYIVVNEAELRLALESASESVEYLATAMSDQWRIIRGAVTLGHSGCLTLQSFVSSVHPPGQHVPPFADKVVDRMGAGDAFLACTAPLAAVGAPAEVIGFIGNVAAAIKVGKLGNQSVTRKELHQWVRSLIA